MYNLYIFLESVNGVNFKILVIIFTLARSGQFIKKTLSVTGPISEESACLFVVKKQKKQGISSSCCSHYRYRNKRLDCWLCGN